MKHDPSFDAVLDTCLDHVLRDGRSVEWCLQQYPEDVSELEPLLRLALAGRASLDPVPSAAAKARARLALRAALQRRGLRRRRWTAWQGLLAALLAQRPWVPRWAMGVVASLAVVVLGGTGVVAASSNSMPDAALYPVKRAVENVRLALAFDRDGRAQLHSSYALRRVKEMAFAARRGDLRRLQGLTTDAEHHLQQVESSVLGLAEAPERPASLDEAELRRLQLLRTLETLAERQRAQELAWQEALREAPAPAQEALRRARQTTEQRYLAMRLVLERLMALEGARPSP
ncbi:MAG: hypothetical protein HY535_04395 [Chloroflexi bacterium]|nr:hypothetical protein [Chloroflexota bacterium]